MNDIRRTILWVVFGFSMVLLWDQWQVFNGNKPTFLPSSKPAVVGGAPTTAGNPNSLPAAAGAVPGAAAVAGSAATLPTQSAAPAGEKVTVVTDVFRAEIDSVGGTLSNLHLLKFVDQADRSKSVELMDNKSLADRYVAETGLINRVDSGERFPNHLTPMTAVSGPRELAPGQDTLEVRFESQPAGGLKYVKTYVFRRGDYLIGVRHEVVNTGQQAHEAQLYLQFVRHGTVPSSTMFGTNTFTGPAFYTEEMKFHKLAFSDIEKKKAELPPP
ncbi:MAG: YidC/Oxa1 family membrane protein insertase, partial [Comamonadaceae bacterium]